MKILKITNEHRNDFSADMKCEHCGAIKHITIGSAPYGQKGNGNDTD